MCSHINTLNTVQGPRLFVRQHGVALTSLSAADRDISLQQMEFIPGALDAQKRTKQRNLSCLWCLFRASWCDRAYEITPQPWLLGGEGRGVFHESRGGSASGSVSSLANELTGGEFDQFEFDCISHLSESESRL